MHAQVHASRLNRQDLNYALLDSVSLPILEIIHHHLISFKRVFVEHIHHHILAMKDMTQEAVITVLTAVGKVGGGRNLLRSCGRE